MEFVFADSLGIESNLVVLRPDTQPFLIHFYQHTGNFFGSAARIGNENEADAILQFRYFLNTVRQRNSDLVLTPEYSCPFTNIIEIVSDNAMWPAAGKLWVLGCESITRVELAAFAENCTDPNIHLHHEPDNPENNKDFYDPLVYMFKGRHQGREKLIVLIQFKTVHMGAWGSATERDHLIEGSIVYVLRNTGESNRFISIICSEAMNFQAQLTAQKRHLIGWNDFPYFVYNPQANPDPTHDDFVNFRKFVLRTDRKEILSLNWNYKTRFGNGDFIRHGTTRSGIYTQSLEVDLREPRFKHNHSNGAYYHKFGITNHAFLLNKEVDIFLVRLAPVRILGDVQPQVRRDGPEILEVESYERPTGTFTNLTGHVPDGHMHYFGSLNCGCNYLMNEHGCIIEKERLVCLSSGLVKEGLPLLNIPGIQSFEMKQDVELNVRITVIDDNRPDAIQKNSGYIDSINTIIHNIIPVKNENHYPESIRDFRNENITIGFSETSKSEDYKFNVIRTTGQSLEATMVYAGGVSKKDAERIFDNVQSLFEHKSKFKRRVLVYYRHGVGYLSIKDGQAGMIGHTELEDGPTITNTQK
jgi:hypothetical protein